jgi:hypothetical protein
VVVVVEGAEELTLILEVRTIVVFDKKVVVGAGVLPAIQTLWEELAEQAGPLLEIQEQAALIILQALEAQKWGTVQVVQGERGVLVVQLVLMVI